MQIGLVLLIAAGSLVATASRTPATETLICEAQQLERPSLRLSPAVRPKHYKLHLSVDHSLRHFSGSVQITLQLRQAVDSLELHAARAGLVREPHPRPRGAWMTCHDE